MIVQPVIRAGSRYAGAVDYLDPMAGLRGWLVNLERRGAPVRLAVRCAGRRVACTVAVLDRPDIDKVVGYPTRCGFLIGWSRFDLPALREVAAEVPDAELEFFLPDEEDVDVAMTRAPMTAAEAEVLISASPKGDRRSVFDRLNAYLDIEASGVFDADWYGRHRTQRDETLPALLDYIENGEPDGATPSLYFDPDGYATMAGLEDTSGALHHYVLEGEALHIGAGIHFDERWYRTAYDVPNGRLPLAHYMEDRRVRAPNRWFDPAFYVGAAGAPDAADPYEHFVMVGLGQGIPPSPVFRSDGVGAPPEGLAFLDALRAGVRRLTEEGHAEPEDAPPVEVAPTEAEVAASAATLTTPPPEPAPIPPAVEAPSFAELERHLRALPPDEAASLVLGAESDLEEGDPERVPAASIILAAARGLAGDRLGSARAQITYLSSPAGLPTPAMAETEARIAALNHALFDSGNRVEAIQVYRLLHARGYRDQLVALRLLEHALAEHADAAGYAAVLDEDSATGRISLWGALGLSRYHLQRGDRARSVEVLRRVPPAGPPEAEATIAHRLLESGALDEAAARLDALGATDFPAVRQARFRLAARRKEIPAMLALLEGLRSVDLPDWLVGETTLMAVEAEQAGIPDADKALQALAHHLEARGIGNNQVVQARIQYLMRYERWEELGTLFQELEGSPFGRTRETLLRKLQYHCLSGDLGEADRLYQNTFATTPLNKWEAVSVLRLLAEQGRWEAAAEVLLTHVGLGFDFAGSDHIAIRIIRRSGLHDRVLALADAVPKEPGPRREPGLEQFLTRVRRDRDIQLAPGRPADETAATWPLGPVRDRAGDAKAFCIFLCVNQDYFLGLLTFLLSFFGQPAQSGARVFVFVDRDVPRHWLPAIHAVAAHFGRTLDVVEEGNFVPAGVEHRTGFGFFSGGNSLARAAYFRLYAARHLLQEHDFQRAVYLDADIICRADLGPLFRLDLGNDLVAARVEDYSPGVASAARRNGLDPHGYVNSGVLLFRFDDPRLPEALDEAIRLAEQEAERLVFHDQCALNLAFRNHIHQMPERYNHFLRPFRAQNGHIEDGALLHFLDRPKPWDVIFDRGYGEEWRVWALLLGAIVPRPLALEFHARANRA